MAASTLITAYLAYGTHAARPASLSLSGSAVGFYFETDTTTLFCWENGAWTQVSNSALASISDGQLLSNISGGSAAPVGNGLSAILDHIIGSTRGTIIFRGASGWTNLNHGTANQVLTMDGSGNDPTWATPAAAGGGLYSQVLSASVPTKAVVFPSITNLNMPGGSTITDVAT